MPTLKIKKLSLSIFLSALALFFVVHTAQAQSFETTAKQAILFDAQTGQVLFEKNADERMPTSSMSKVMTAIVIFDALQSGHFSLQDKLTISETAWRKGGSKMFVALGSQVSIEDLLRGVIIQSGNDATIALAEGLAGSEEAFAALLNKKAQEIGMENSNFTNASGWPDENHYSTARDLKKMAVYLHKNYPEYYRYYSEIDFTYNNIKQGNRNPLLYKKMGVDGIKTGHTSEAGYGLIASAERNGRRLFMVVNGLESMNARSSESERLINWGYSQFRNIRLFKEGEVIDQASVWLGQNTKIPLVIQEDVVMTIPSNQFGKMNSKLVYESPVPAPVMKGDKIGTIEIEVSPQLKITRDVFAGEDSPQLGIFARSVEKIRYAVLGQK